MPDFGGSNREALGRALEASNVGVDQSAQAFAALSLAGLLDADPDDTDLWREYRLMLKELKADGGDDAFDEWLRTQVSNTEDGPAHARAEARGAK